MPKTVASEADAAAELAKLSEGETRNAEGGTGEADETATGEADAVTTESTDDEGSTGEPGEKQKVPAEVQEAIDRRIGKEIEKARKAQERAEALEAQVEELKGKTDETWMNAAQALAVHPRYLPKDDAALIAQANALEAEELRLSEHPDGIESDDPKVAMSAADVRKRMVQVRQELTRIAPKADAAYSKAKAQQIADLEAGFQLRKQKEQAAAKAKNPGDRRQEAASAAPSGSSAPSRPVSTGVESRASLNAKRFKESGGDRNAAARELANLVPVD